MTGDEPAAYLAARAGIDDVDDRLRTRMAAFSARSHAGRASAPWFGAAGRRTVVSGRRGDGGVGAASRVAGRRWCRGGVEGGGATVVSGGDGGVGAALGRRGDGGVEGGGATVVSGRGDGGVGRGDRGRGSRARAREREGICTK